MHYESDRRAADTLRDALKEKYPDDFKGDNLGNMPNNALYHSETTVLLRAARQNGGALTGMNLEVYSDRQLCNNCEKILPYVGVELGNPTVTYLYGPKGSEKAKTMRDGRWLEEGQ